jgi:hypothetical protein
MAKRVSRDTSRRGVVFYVKDRTNEDNFKKSQQINDERVRFGNFTRNTHTQGLSTRAKKIKIGVDIHELQFFKV